MRSARVEPQSPHGFEIVEPHPPSVPVPAPACGCSGHQSRIKIEITETSTSSQSALGSRFFTEKKRPSYVATWFDRAGCVALGTGRSYGAEFLAAGYSPRINAPHANRSSPSLCPTCRVAPKRSSNSLHPRPRASVSLDGCFLCSSACNFSPGGRYSTRVRVA